MFEELAARISLKAAIRIAIGVAFALVLAWGVRVDHLRAGYKAEIVQLNKDHAAEIAKLKSDTAAAAKQAQADWQAKVTTKEKEYEAKASDADNNYAALHDQYAAAVVRARTAARAGGAGGATASASGGGAGVPAQGAGAAQLCISDEDAMKVADLAAYAQAAHDWVLTLEPSSDM